MHKRIPIAVAEPYDVIIGTNILTSLATHVAEHELVVLADTNTAQYASELETAFRAAGRKVLSVRVQPGEQSKTIGTWEAMLHQLSEAKVTRRAALVAVGGGVVGDLGGFVAASYLRGIAYYQVPTTVLAMVDSSVGGKTGLNLPTGKNLVGAFWQPRAVFADLAVLRTLPAKEFKAGTAELFKAGLLANHNLAQAVLTDWHQHAAPELLATHLASGVRVKARIVAEDTFETGSRAFLNLGHTVAHALEGATNHTIPHGVAVAYGLVFAAALGNARGWFNYEALTHEFLAKLGVRYELPDFATLEPFIDRDKKVGPDGRTYVLLRNKEQPILVNNVTHDEELQAYNAVLEVAK